MREYKHRARFEAVARCVLEPSTQGKFLAKASLADLKMILPADAEDYPDLLPIAGNACVINLGNGNGDMMDTDVAVHIFKQFVHKPINIEHDRTVIVGHITNSALTKFHSNYKLGTGSDIVAVEDVHGSFDPFNIAIGGYIYRAMHEAVSSKIVESNDPDSPEFLSIAFSWELAFDEHQLFAGSKERGGNGEIISDPAKIEAFGSFLKCNKGTGLLPDGRPVYRLVSWAKQEGGAIDPDSILAMGVALTLAPAGAVAGVITTETHESEASLQEISTKNENSNKIISQSSKADVTTNTTITMKVIKDLNDLKTLNDENVKEYSFANIQHVVEAGTQSIQKQLEADIAAKSQKWAADLAEKEQAAASAKKNADEALVKVTELEAGIKIANDKVAALEVAQQVSNANAEFQKRMSFFDEKFELEDSDRKAIASRIKGLDETAFAEIANNEISVFLAAKSKEAIAKAKETAAASQTKPTDEEAKKIAAEALAKAQTSQASLPNTTDSSNSLKDKYLKAFEVGKGVVIENK